LDVWNALIAVLTVEKGDKVMFQLDRLVYATNRPEKVDLHLQTERGLPLAASGRSFPGVATRIYPFPGGGFLEVAYIENEKEIAASEEGVAMRDLLKEQGDGFTALVLETDDLDRVKRILEEEGYPVSVTPVQEVTDPTGQTVRFQMLGTYPHLPWFVQYEKPRESRRGYPQAAIIRTTTLTADVHILEKLLEMPATEVKFPDTTAAILPLYNATLRLESADAYGFTYFDPKGLLLEMPLTDDVLQ
jgi:hypothetical protein